MASIIPLLNFHKVSSHFYIQNIFFGGPFHFSGTSHYIMHADNACICKDKYVKLCGMCQSRDVKPKIRSLAFMRKNPAWDDKVNDRKEIQLKTVRF